MSQAKVDAYKNQKANRKQEMQKEKRNKLIAKIISGVVVLALVGWIGFSVNNMIVEKQNSEALEVNMDAIYDYYSSIEE